MFWNFWDRTVTERTVDCGRSATDDIADLLIASGQGDLQAEEELLTTRCCNDGIWPGQTILEAPLHDDPPQEASLDRGPKP